MEALVFGRGRLIFSMSSCAASPSRGGTADGSMPGLELSRSAAPTRSGGLQPLRLCIVDMNNAYLNQAMRCIRGIVATFFERVQAHNPDLVCERVEVSPRDTNNVTPTD